MNNRVSIITILFCLMLSGITGRAESRIKPFCEINDLLIPDGQIGAMATPTMSVSPNGTVVLVVNQRMGNSGDSGNEQKVIILRSTDNGKTWLNRQMIAEGQGLSFWPTGLVSDDETNKMFLFIGVQPLLDRSGNPMHEKWAIENPEKAIEIGLKVLVLESSDNGENWSEPRDITRDLQPERNLLPTGLQSGGCGIQLRNSEYKGRLVIANRYWSACRFDHSDFSNMRNCVFYSDNHGQTWQPGGIAPQGYVGECAIVELSDGAIYMSHRNHDPQTRGQRSYAMSTDGGITFTEAGLAKELTEPVCHAALSRYNRLSESMILFCNPADKQKRKNMTIRASFDDASTWPVVRLLDDGKSGYSALAVASDGTIICAYERGENNYRKNIALARFNLAWLMAKAVSASK